MCFQEMMDDIFQDMDGVLWYLDNILIHIVSQLSDTLTRFPITPIYTFPDYTSA